MAAACKGCRFIGPQIGYDSYTCRRHAPIAAHKSNGGIHEDAFVPRWPTIRGHDWCGDFERVAEDEAWPKSVVTTEAHMALENDKNSAAERHLDAAIANTKEQTYDCSREVASGD